LETSKEVNWNLAFAMFTDDDTKCPIRHWKKAWLIEAIKGNSIPLADVPESLLFSFLFNAHASHFQTKGIFLYFFNNCNSIYTHGVWRYRTTGGRPEVV